MIDEVEFERHLASVGFLGHVHLERTSTRKMSNGRTLERQTCPVCGAKRQRVVSRRASGEWSEW